MLHLSFAKNLKSNTTKFIDGCLKRKRHVRFIKETTLIRQENRKMPSNHILPAKCNSLQNNFLFWNQTRNKIVPVNYQRK